MRGRPILRGGACPRELTGFGAQLGQFGHEIEELLVAVPGEVAANLFHREPHQVVHLFIRCEFSVVHAHEVIRDDLGLAFTVRVIGRANESFDVTVHARLFGDLAKRRLFKGLSRIEFPFRERPVTPRFAIDTRNLHVRRTHATMHNAACGADEVGGGVPGNNEFAAQQVHTSNARGRAREFLAYGTAVRKQFTFVE